MRSINRLLTYLQYSGHRNSFVTQFDPVSRSLPLRYADRAMD